MLKIAYIDQRQKVGGKKSLLASWEAVKVAMNML